MAGELGFRFNLLVEPSPIRIRAFQIMRLEELRPQPHAIRGSRRQGIKNRNLTLRYAVVDWYAKGFDDLQVEHGYCALAV